MRLLGAAYYGAAVELAGYAEGPGAVGVLAGEGEGRVILDEAGLAWVAVSSSTPKEGGKGGTEGFGTYLL